MTHTIPRKDNKYHETTLSLLSTICENPTYALSSISSLFSTRCLAFRSAHQKTDSEGHDILTRVLSKGVVNIILIGTKVYVALDHF